MTVNLASGAASGEGDDLLHNIENVLGSSKADTLGEDGPRKTRRYLGRLGRGRQDFGWRWLPSLHGGAGDDVMSGGGGDDLIDGDNGDDSLTAGRARRLTRWRNRRRM